MSYQIDYTSVKDADREAINDAIRYMGLRRSKVIIRKIKESKPAETDAIHFICRFAGISGFPVDALIRRYQPSATS